MDYMDHLNAILNKLDLSKEEIEELKNSWVGQETGTINQYKDHHQGTQPIRVINNMFLFMFIHTYPSFKEKLQKMVDEGKLNPKIAMKYEENSINNGDTINSPRVSAETRQISLHETFLSYLWCVSYAVYILYIEKVDYPQLNKQAGKEIYKVNENEITKAKELFNYGKSLIAYYSPWDKDTLPNPEIYLAENRNYVEQTNMCYTVAVTFILAHELTHLERHLDQLDSKTPNSHYLAFEEEADREAINHTIKLRGQMGDIAVNTGIIVGLLSMLYFSVNTTGLRHPNIEDRITNALEILELNENDPAWGMACVGLELWEQQFDLSFDWLSNPDSPRQQYYHLVEQIQ